MSACVTSSQSIFECNEPKTTSTHNHISLENTCLELIIPQVEIPITSPSTVILNADLNPSNSSIPKISSNKNSLLSPMKLALCKKFKNKIVKISKLKSQVCKIKAQKMKCNVMKVCNTSYN